MSDRVTEIGIKPAPAWVKWSTRGVRMLPRGRYVVMNWLCRRPGAPFDSPLGVTGDRVRFACDLKDGIAREACFMGYYEPQETVLVRHLLRPGMTFVDAGANWGYFTLLAATLVGSTGRVVSFEPHPELYPLLRWNVERNHFTWVKTSEVAIADSDGEMNLAGFTESGTNHGVSRLTEDADSHTPNFLVRTGLLEALLDECGVAEVDFLKMDIEGAEGLALPAMRESLARLRYKRILLELHPLALREQGIAPTNLVEQILVCGYRAWRLDHSRAAFRRASYRLPKSPDEFLSHFDLNSPLDAWPHILFLAPGVKLPWGGADR